jgi:DNA-binding transcriptional MocR family regulator
MARKVANTNGGATQAVAAALAARPGSTAAELADAAGVGQFTATKALASLEAEGQVTRVPGGRGANGRRQPDRWHPPQPAASSPRAHPAATSTGEDGTRLGRGELVSLVVEFLAMRPAEAVGPVAVAKGLGRSSGAVANALSRLSESGTVLLVGDQPRRYRLAPPLNRDRELAG